MPRTATAKFKRAPATGAERKQRDEFGRTWGAFNSAAAKKLRSDSGLSGWWSSTGGPTGGNR